MRKLILLLLITPLYSIAQNVTIHFKIKNALAESFIVYYRNSDRPDVVFENWETEIPIHKGSATWEAEIHEPEFVELWYEDTNETEIRYLLYVSPGDAMTITLDIAEPTADYSISGIGSNFNQPMIQKTYHPVDFSTFRYDSVPDKLIEVLNQQYQESCKILDDYFKIYETSKAFQQAYKFQIEYQLLLSLVSIRGINQFTVRDAMKPNFDKWQAVEDSLIQTSPLNNDSALISSSYPSFLSIFLLRYKERLWYYPELYKQYYSSSEDSIWLSKDHENLLRERIIQKHFSGKSAEYLYAVLFSTSFNQKEDNLPEIYNRFKEAYPNSKYIPFIEPQIEAIKKRRNNVWTDEMIILDVDSIQSFNDLLENFKGKTVLLDMWGTWCAPCRSEILNNSEELKKHFKDQGVVFLYISNYDTRNTELWKELIAYYNLSGYHIQAPEQLTRDIQKEIDSNSFPTYVIIKPDGTFEKSEATYPMDRTILIEQIEDVLKSNKKL